MRGYAAGGAASKYGKRTISGEAEVSVAHQAAKPQDNSTA
jgi:hypothetical protein